MREDPPRPPLGPEVVVDQLRAMRDQIAEVTPLTGAERKLVRDRGRTDDAVLQASINVVGASDKLSHAVGMPIDEVRGFITESDSWMTVEREVRALLRGIEGANLIRRQRIALIAAQAYKIALELVRDPANALLLPHVEEIKRLRRLARRKKPAPEPEASGDPKS